MRQVWQTTDGQTFSHQEEAEHWQHRLDSIERIKRILVEINPALSPTGDIYDNQAMSLYLAPKELKYKLIRALEKSIGAPCVG